MISVEEAKELLFKQISKSESVELEISKAVGFVLSKDIYSPIHQPSFANSAMDGYAVASTDHEDQRIFKVIGEIKAGDSSTYTLQSGEAVRIFTGAQIPEGADSVVIQENVERENDTIILIESFKKGAFVRAIGSMMKKGELALEKDMVLNAASIGFLASMGFTQISVYKNPSISIITTGDEIVKPGFELKQGQIYESNSFALTAALQGLNSIPNQTLMASDTIESLRQQIKIGLEEADILILTGGISVGKYDLVYEVLNKFEVIPVFYKVAQKPGKPFFAGKLGHKFIFALPGNPAAVLVCFYEYIYTVIRIMQGFSNPSLEKVTLRTSKTISNHESRSQFIRAKIVDGIILPLDGQDSFMLHSFAMADALIYIANGNQTIHENDEVEVHVLPI